MKKLFTMLFALVVAFALSMPVFAQEAPAGQEQTQEAPAPAKKSHKLKLHRKAKKEKKEKKEEKKEEKEAPPSGN